MTDSCRSPFIVHRSSFKKMLLVLDVGNSNTTLGLYDGESLVQSWRLTSERQRTVDEYGMMCRSLLQLCDLPATTITDMAISSVVPPLDFTLFKMAEKFFNLRPLFVNAAEAGSDRLVNAVAAYEKYGGPCIIVDFGTGTNFDVVSKDGEFIGGVI